jgi:hypothetical protein
LRDDGTITVVLVLLLDAWTTISKPREENEDEQENDDRRGRERWKRRNRAEDLKESLPP